MRTNTALVLVLAASTLVASSASSFALGSKPGGHKQGFAVFDANTGDKVFDDGKLDGKGCAVGSVATFDPATGKFGTKPSFKCNFQQ